MPGRPTSGGGSAGKFRLSKNFGPPKLQRIHDEIVAQINRIKPIKGIGIIIDQRDDGSQISADHPATPNSDDPGSGAGGSGAAVSVYGAVNGAPGVFHLLQSHAPTPL